MMEFLSHYRGMIFVNGKQIDKTTIGSILDNSTVACEVKLIPPDNENFDKQKRELSSREYIITVQEWMMKKSSSTFNFMAQWNDDRPMPLRTMRGTILQETRGMYKMNLRGIPQNTCECLRCGRLLRNPVSRLYGIGPECMEQLGIPREYSNETAKEKIKFIEHHIETTTWQGWVAKSAISAMKELK